jgi:serine/threonine protein kinase
VPTLSTGTLLGGRYEIIRAIKSGGMGAVYEARDRRLADSPCAVKQLLDEDFDEESLVVVRRKFDEEMQFLATLNHPGIPRLRDFFVHERRQYLVMDLVEGETLEQELDTARAEGRRCDPARVVADGIEVLDILTYLHRRTPPVVHRDIKPANLIRERSSGRVKLVDFGIARLHQVSSTTTHTQLGTLCYAPLEQIQGHAEPRSDLYALGATMHHLISGKESAALAISPLQRLAPDVDPDLAAIVNRAVEGNPVDRYDSASEMREALADWLARHGRGATATLPPAGGATSPLEGASSPTAVRLSARPTTLETPPRFPYPLVASLLAIMVAIAFALWHGLASYPTASASHEPETTASAAARTGPEAGFPSGGARALSGEAGSAENPARRPGTEPATLPAGRETPREVALANPRPSPHPRVSYSAPAVRPSPSTPRPRPQVVDVIARPAATPPPAPAPTVATAPPPRQAPTPHQVSVQVAPPAPAPTPPSQSGPPPGQAPPPQGVEGLSNYSPSLPVGWSAPVTLMTQNPPHKEFRVTGPEVGQGSLILFIVFDMPNDRIEDVLHGVVNQLANMQWTATASSFARSGDLNTLPIAHGGQSGLLEVRLVQMVPGQARMFAAACLPSSAPDLSPLKRVAEQFLLR